MHSTTLLIAIAATADLITGRPINTRPLGSTQCGQWDLMADSSYTLYQDLWNMDASSGSQCSSIDSLSGNTLAWHTTWSWSDDPTTVKSYANAVVDFTSKPLDQIGSINTQWSYRYTPFYHFIAQPKLPSLVLPSRDPTDIPLQLHRLKYGRRHFL